MGLMAVMQLLVSCQVEMGLILGKNLWPLGSYEPHARVANVGFIPGRQLLASCQVASCVHHA
jgi:hypothetical protein